MGKNKNGPKGEATISIATITPKQQPVKNKPIFNTNNAKIPPTIPIAQLTSA